MSQNHPRIVRARLHLETLEQRLTPTNVPVLIDDIAPDSSSSDPSSFAGMGDYVYFAASTGTAPSSTIGDELWRTDVHGNGAELVADLYPGGSGLFVKSGSPRNLTTVGDTLFFTATDAGTGLELWKSDGTFGGTDRVKDIRLGTNSSSPTLLTAVGDSLYFVATDAMTGTELWKSDGTEAGTTQVIDLAAGSASTNFQWLKVINGKLFFGRLTPMGSPRGADVFSVNLDGSGVTPVFSYSEPLPLVDPVVIGSQLFYHAITTGPNDTLFVADMAVPSPTPVGVLSIQTDINNSVKFSELAAIGNRLFFAAITAVGTEPWISDGTVLGTHIVKDISQDTPGNNPSSSPTEFTNVGGIAFFAATTIAHGRELWRSDGTAAGTFEVADLELGDTSSSPSNLIEVGGHLVFDTFIDAASSKLWQYDPATGQKVVFPTFGLSHGFVTEYPWAVYNDVLYMGPYVVGSTLGLEPYKLEFDPGTPVIAGFDSDTGIPGDGVTSDTTIRLFGTANANNSIRVYEQAALLGTTTADAGGQWQFNTGVLVDGPNSFLARAVNLNDTESPNSNLLTITVDTVPPPVPAITSFSDNTGVTNDNVTNDPTITLAGTAEANITVRVLDGIAILGNVLASIDGTWSFTTATLADGTHPFTAQAIDAAGNASPASSSFPVVIDTAAPMAPIVVGFADDSGTVGDGITNDKTPTLHGTAEPSSVVEVSDGAIPLGTTLVELDGSWQFTAPELGDGDHSFAAIAIDVAGNVSSNSTALDVTIDATRPTVTVNQIAGQVDPTGVGPIAFTVKFSKPVTGFTSTDVNLSASTVGGTLGTNVSGSGTDYTVIVTGMNGQGDVVASIPVDVAFDVAGNGNTLSSSTDNSVHFDNAPPTVTIVQASGQADPTNVSPVVFKVTFNEPVTGFTAADVDLAGSTVGGTLVVSVSGSGADYSASVSGMFGLGTVVASIPTGAAVDIVGNASLASTSSDNTVIYNNIGNLQFGADVFSIVEGIGNATVTVHRINGSDEAVSVDWATSDGTAHAGSDYTTTSGTLQWATGDSSPKTFTVSIINDAANEGRENINLTLSNPTGLATLGAQATARLAIAPSDGTGPGTFSDFDGDAVTVKLTPKTGAGSLLVYLTDPDGDGKGPVELIELTNSTSKSAIAVTVKKIKGGNGDGRVGLGGVTGGELKSLTAKTADLDGDGIDLDGYLGSVAIGNVLNGADIIAGGTTDQKTKISTLAIGDGTTIKVSSAIGNLTAIRIGVGAIVAPSIGTMMVKGQAKPLVVGDMASDISLNGNGLAAGKSALGSLTVAGSIPAGVDIVAPSVGTITVKRDLAGDITISGAGVAPTKKALTALKVSGVVSASDIFVTGNVGTVLVGAFRDSRLFAGYTGADDGSGTFSFPATVTTFKSTGKIDGFQNSRVIATNFKTVSIINLDSTNVSNKFGFYADTSLGAIYVVGPTKFKYLSGLPTPQGLGDFELKIV